MSQVFGGPGGPMGPVMVLNSKTQRKTGREAVLSNIGAARAVANIVRTTLGPRSMLKMLLDPMGTIVLTNDGHAILREVDVSHPTAKSMLELSRTQDEEVGDGTTSVIVLAAQVLTAAEPLLRQDAKASMSMGITSRALHPVVLVSAYHHAQQIMIEILKKQAIKVEVTSDDKKLRALVQSTLGTKFGSRWMNQLVDMSIQAVLTVAKTPSDNAQQQQQVIEQDDKENKNTTTEVSSTTPTETTPTSSFSSFTAAGTNSSTKMEVDLKRYAKVEKIPGGEISDSKVLDGVMFQKDVVHSGMKRTIKNPRILLLDTPLEYKKGESAAHVEVNADDDDDDEDPTKPKRTQQEKENDWNALLKIEEEYVERQCRQIIAHNPDVVITEKGVSDLAQHYLHKANITVFRRVRKTDNNRIARAVHATIVSRTDEITDHDIGKGCGLFTMKKIANDWFVYLVECKNPTACTIVLRGGSKDVLNELERNLQDSMQVIRNVVYNPYMVVGGGATEMSISVGLKRYALQHVHGIHQAPMLAVAQAMEIIPQTLVQNCGVNVIRTLTQLRAIHADAYDNNKEEVVEKQQDVVNNNTDDDDITKKMNFVRCTYGIQGITGEVVDMEDTKHSVWEPLSVKLQTIQTAMESACMILRIDDIVSGTSKRK